MERGLRIACGALVLAVLAGCSGGGDDRPAATLQTSTTAHTTTTLSVEAQVEAAYLKSWDVYSKAALDLDTSHLRDLYAGPALQLVLDDIAQLKARNARGRFEVVHKYDIAINGQAATVTDDYLNHSVLIDPATREPIEPDPNKTVHETYLLTKFEDGWKVVDIVR